MRAVQEGAACAAGGVERGGCEGALFNAEVDAPVMEPRGADCWGAGEAQTDRTSSSRRGAPSVLGADAGRGDIAAADDRCRQVHAHARAARGAREHVTR